MTLLRLLGRLLVPQRGWLALLLVLQAAQALTQLVLPSLLGQLLDRTLRSGGTAHVAGPAATMAGVSLGCMAVSVAAVYCGTRAALGAARDLRGELFARVLSWSAEEHSRFGPSTLTTRMTNDVQQVQVLAASAVSVALLTPLTVAGGVALALRQDVPMAGVLIATIPVIVGVMGVLLFRMLGVATRQQHQVETLNTVAREQITGLRVLRAFVREDQEKLRFDGINQELTSSMIVNGRLNAALMPAIVLVLNLASAALVWIGAARVGSGTTTVGEIVAFLNYLGIVLVAVVMAAFVASMIPRAATCATRIQEVLDTTPAVRAPRQAVRGENLPDVIRLRQVAFTYPGAESPVLADVDLTLSRGRSTAIIGSTGAGKTTLLNLVCRLLDPSEGRVCVDDVDLRTWDPAQWRRHLALVPQKPFLFKGTVAENVRHGLPHATDEAVWAALRAAQAEEFVGRLPQGIESPVEQGGTNFSGGQRQRLAIARALVRRPQFYLFDDSFSALDLATESRLRSELRTWTSDAGVVTVAQRVSSIVDADEIVVLDAGAVVGRGTHAQLLARCLTYAEIVESQGGNRELVG